MWKLVSKLSCNNGGNNTTLLFHGLRRPLLQYSTSSEHPSSSLPSILVENLGFSEQQSVSISAKIAARFRAEPANTRLTALTFAANANSVINFFKSHGFNDSHIRNFVSYDPRILSMQIDKTLNPRFRVLQDLGISGSDLISVLSANPQLIMRRFETVLQELSVFLGTHENLVAFFKKRRLFLGNTLSPSPGHLISNWRLLENDYGISPDTIRSHIIHNEGVFLRDSNVFRKTLIEVEHKWGISPSSGSFLHGVFIFGSLKAELIESKIRMIKSFGWNQSHIMTIIKKFPRCLGFSEARLKKSLEFLVNEMCYEPAYLACHPALFSYSLETRLVPRHRILVVLREKGLIASDCSLHYVASFTEPKFFLKFVEPFKDDVPDLYQNYVSSRGCQTNEMEIGAALKMGKS